MIRKSVLLFMLLPGGSCLADIRVTSAIPRLCVAAFFSPFIVARITINTVQRIAPQQAEGYLGLSTR